MKKIIIIGASSGLGRRIASDFAQAGWKVGVAARREEPLREISTQHPGQVEYMTIDVCTNDAVARFNDLINLTDGMDTLLFAAGTGFYDPELVDDKLVGTLQTNVVGFARIVAEAYKYFRRNNVKGQIAAITSVAGTKGIGVSAAYSSSKRFQQMFLDSLDQLAYRQGVDMAITDIRPGFIRTDLLDPSRQYPMIMTVDYAARLIERAIVRRRRVTVIDCRWRVLTALWSLMPRCLWRRLPVQF